MNISICLAGDVVPRERTTNLFLNKDSEYIFGELMPIINTCDIKIVNLEAPIIYGEPTPINKVGPNLHTTPETAETLKLVGFNVFALANNHFRDQGDNGVFCTLCTCDDLGIKHVGGGRNISAAGKTLLWEENGKKVAIINACESEFSIASNTEGGVIQST